MATSGSIDFNVTRTEIITEALQLCGVVPEGGTANSSQLSDMARSLNLLLKSKQSEGMQLWAIKHIVLFPEADKIQYKISNVSGADHACNFSDFVKTQVRTDYTSGTTLEVDSTTGMTNSDFIGVVTDSGTIEWKTLTVVDSDTITLSGALSTTAAVDNYVYTYTSKPYRPLKIVNAWVRNESSLSDTPVMRISREEYTTLNSKYTEADYVNQIWYDPQIDHGYLNVWPEPNNMVNTIHLQVQRPFEDMDNATDNLDFPQEWYSVIVYELALWAATKYGVDAGTFQKISTIYTMLKSNVSSFDTEQESLFIGAEHRY